VTEPEASDSLDPWSPTALFYDLDLEGVEDDVTMYCEIALRQGGPVLELGCGTGRVALALARAGLTVTGVDSSASMLDVARSQSGGLPLTLLEADMREVRLRRKFATVLIPLGGLQHMATAEEVTGALDTCARHLAVDGLVLVDVEAPQPEDLTPGPRPLIAHWTRPWRGGMVTKLVAVDGRPSEGTRLVTFHYDVQPAEGPLHRLSHEFVLRVITAGELELAGRLAGLEMTALYGDYELSPLQDGDVRQVAVFEHAR
jgi:ubiquinone/menaquinone biosynthesis C-methylase UbiE